MRDIDADTATALMGSRVGDRLICHAWYGGTLTVTDMQVKEWSFTDDDTAQVKGSLGLTVVDDTNRLTPWLLEDPLGVGGAEVQVLYQVGGAGIINVGWYRITRNQPDETWRTYIVKDHGKINLDSPIPPGKSLKMVPGGVTVQLTLTERTTNAVNGRLLAPESPKGATPTVVSEVTRLLDGIMPVVVDPAVVDANVSKKTVYSTDRMNEIESLLNIIECTHRMTSDGAFEIYPLAKADPVWKIAGGPEGALVRVNHSTSLDGLYNIVVVDGTRQVTKKDGSTVDVPVRGIARLTEGPLRHDGPHGEYVYFHSSPLATTQAIADKTAQTMLSNFVRDQTVDLDVTCLPNLAIQQGDWVEVMNPVIDGNQRPLVGRVVRRTLAGTDKTVNPMDLTVRCSYLDAQTVIQEVDRSGD